jgi:Zn-dependent peptidase ImmA (M78 family)/transcriptional regulator with XRE-family HTH domain
MANYASGVNPSILRWARERTGYSLQDIAARLKRDVEEVAQWEEGIAVPTYNQLERLAYTYYKRPIALFFFPEPPEEPEPQDSFRTLPDFEIRDLQPDTRIAIREAQAMQISLHELTNGANPSERLIFRELEVRPGRHAALAAKDARAYLGISLDVQFEWSGTVEALKKWRQIIQDQGVFVFKRHFDQTDVSGFSVADDEFPVIYLNNSTAKTRQIFSLFHELAHILLDTSGVTKVDDRYIDALTGWKRQIEVFCNRFAAEFLVPSEDFGSRLQALHAEPVEQVVEKLSDVYHVSREVILRNLLDRGIVDQEYYQAKAVQWMREFQEAQRAKRGRGYYYATQATYLGNKYISLAFSSYYSGECSLQELAGDLGMKPKNVAEFERYVLGRGS